MAWFKKKLLREDPKPSSVDDSSSDQLRQEKATHLQSGLQKTRQFLGEKLARLLLRQKQLDPALIEELETCLLSADVGVATTTQLLSPLTQSVSRNECEAGVNVYAALKQRLIEQLKPHCIPLRPRSDSNPFVVLVVGVNGAGKTTSIAKLARQWQLEGKKVMLAAGDTFRAAAVEQLQHWGEQFDIPVIAQGIGSDSAAVIYDAVESAKARNIDIVLADTAGRLHTQSHLMDELKKIKRVLKKIDGSLPHETMLVLDAGIGQNALNQVKQFHEAIELTGLSVTKMDGTAKGGMVFALSQAFAIPFRFIGVGEAVEDLQEFDAESFVEAILNDDTV